MDGFLAAKKIKEFYNNQRTDFFLPNVMNDEGKMCPYIVALSASELD